MRNQLQFKDLEIGNLFYMKVGKHIQLATMVKIAGNQAISISEHASDLALGETYIIGNDKDITLLTVIKVPMLNVNKDECQTHFMKD